MSLSTAVRSYKARPIMAVMALTLLAAPGTASAFESDVQQKLALWSLAFVNHEYDEHWSTSFQTEVRVKDEVTTLAEAIFKPGGYYRFNDWLELGIGYKYIYKNDGANQNVPWQELYVTHPFQVFGFTHQLRLEERFVQGISGTIPRLRYLIHTTTPLSPLFYFALSEAFRFNLVDKGTGPVSGFEQNRLYAGFGVHASKYLTKSSSDTCGVSSSSAIPRARASTSSASSCYSRRRRAATPPAEGASRVQPP